LQRLILDFHVLVRQRKGSLLWTAEPKSSHLGFFED